MTLSRASPNDLGDLGGGGGFTKGDLSKASKIASRTASNSTLALGSNDARHDAS